MGYLVKSAAARRLKSDMRDGICYRQSLSTSNNKGDNKEDHALDDTDQRNAI